jgi:hypothetical protein
MQTGRQKIRVMVKSEKRPKPKEVWLVADAFVIEPYVGGQQLGELPEFDLTGYKVTRRFTQSEFDAKCVAFHKRHGYWPDT